MPPLLNDIMCVWLCPTYHLCTRRYCHVYLLRLLRRSCFKPKRVRNLFVQIKLLISRGL